jgi:hypothetical protein
MPYGRPSRKDITLALSIDLEMPPAGSPWSAYNEGEWPTPWPPLVPAPYTDASPVLTPSVWRWLLLWASKNYYSSRRYFSDARDSATLARRPKDTVDPSTTTPESVTACLPFVEGSITVDCGIHGTTISEVRWCVVRVGFLSVVVQLNLSLFS